MYKSQNKYKNSNAYKNSNNDIDGDIEKKNLRRNNYMRDLSYSNNQEEVDNITLANNKESLGNESDINNNEEAIKEQVNSTPKPKTSINPQKVKAKINTAKRVISFLMRHPWLLLLVIFFVFFVFIIFVVALDLLGGASGKGSGSGDLLSTYTNCDYITVEGKQIEFETYIAGVVSAENGDPAFPEAMKAQAVAARSYALYKTNYCQKAIKNSQENQVYKEPSEAGIAAAKATENEIMLDADGKIVPAYYASYPSGGEFNWSYGSCDAPLCNGTTCSVTLYKVPTGTKYKFTMDQYNDGNTWNGTDLTNQAGHCYGMSQLGARYLDKKGYSYKQILSYFYDYEPASMKEGLGAIIGNLFGYKTRSTEPTSTDTEWTTENLFYQSRATLIGQCTWYAHGRALEILKNSGLSDAEFDKAKGILNKMSGNAGTWYDINKNLGGEGFAYGSEPKVGSIIVWGGDMEAYKAGKCPGQTYPEAGHVGIVEQVNYNLLGQVTSLRISDGWKTGSGSGWNTVNFQYTEWSMDKVNNYKNGCRPLKGYIYLIE